jgi:hypothetical protein
VIELELKKIKFEAALGALREGHRVTREGWPAKCWLMLINQNVIGQHTELNETRVAQVLGVELMAEDWIDLDPVEEVIDEKKLEQRQ